MDFHFIGALFIAKKIQYRCFFRFYDSNIQYNTDPAFEDILTIYNNEILVVFFTGYSTLFGDLILGRASTICILPFLQYGH